MPLPAAFIHSFQLSCANLASLPDFGVDDFKMFVVGSLAAALMDCTNVDNLFFHESRVIELEHLFTYDQKKYLQLTDALKELEKELVETDAEGNTFPDLKLELFASDRGYLYGAGHISIRATILFKKDKRDAYAAHRESQKLRVFPDEVLEELAQKILAKPGLLEEDEQDPLPEPPFVGSRASSPRRFVPGPGLRSDL